MNGSPKKTQFRFQCFDLLRVRFGKEVKADGIAGFLPSLPFFKYAFVITHKNHQYTVLNYAEK